VSSALERVGENRALSNEARRVCEPQAVLTFKCECEHPLCTEFVVLTLEEYEGVRANPDRAVIALLHAGVDQRSLVERTSRFCIVQGSS
jgi:hypothetical protein